MSQASLNIGRMIPLHLKTEEQGDSPEASIYYLVAENGTFLVRNTELFSSVTEVDSVPGLLQEEASCALHFPRLPRAIMEQMYGFFRAVYQTWDGEAVAFLFYEPESSAFRLGIPPQTLVRHCFAGYSWTEKSVSYGYLPRPRGFVKLGDAHSHPNLSAFFSCTDDRDDDQDGLRIVIGALESSSPDVSVSFVAGGTRFSLSPEDALEDFRGATAPPKQWLDQVTCLENGEPLIAQWRCE